MGILLPLVTLDTRSSSCSSVAQRPATKLRYRSRSRHCKRDLVVFPLRLHLMKDSHQAKLLSSSTQRRSCRYWYLFISLASASPIKLVNGDPGPLCVPACVSWFGLGKKTWANGRRKRTEKHHLNSYFNF